MRVRHILLPVVTGSLLLGLAACGSGSSASGSSSTTASATTTANAPVTSTHNQVAATQATGSTATAGANQYTVDLTVQQDGLGLLSVTNSSKAKETINGWPTLSFLNAADEPLSVPVKNVKIPGAAMPITLAPGQTAFAGVKWTDGDKGSSSTFVATTLKVTAPGGSAPLVANVIGTNGKKQGYYEFDITSVQVGTLQPSTQGVLVFD
ncbi:MAG TPA: DUF4232 domain-containing protein [Pseudonocardiaceae bacterium]|jgi:hypothetical protein|nr:DUF4232 domain-containing protein [Pseudonocardiaceae bacterium]